MTQNVKLSEYMKAIKKPSLSMLFVKYENNEPNDSSHLGGFPFFTNNDKWPVCHHCQKDMHFFMQLREIDKNGKVILKTFYNCGCQIENFTPYIKVFEYENPSMENCIKMNNNTATAPYVDIKLEPSWSIPNWALLPQYNQEIYKLILSLHNNDSDLAEDYYDTLRWNENYLATEPYSLISGYPEFISDPKIIKCECCKKNTEFIFQLDTDEEFQLDWNGGVLYCFKCPETQTLHFTIN